MPGGIGAGINYRHENQVNELESFSVITSKINYVVPVGMDLFIEHVYAAISDGTKYVFALIINGVHKYYLGSGAAANASPVTFPFNNPIEANEGDVITLTRITGSANKDWAGGFIGYLESNT